MYTVIHRFFSLWTPGSIVIMPPLALWLSHFTLCLFCMFPFLVTCSLFLPHDSVCVIFRLSWVHWLLSNFRKREDEDVPRDLCGTYTSMHQLAILRTRQSLVQQGVFNEFTSYTVCQQVSSATGRVTIVISSENLLVNLCRQSVCRLPTLLGLDATYWIVLCIMHNLFDCTLIICLTVHSYYLTFNGSDFLIFDGSARRPWLEKEHSEFQAQVQLYSNSVVSSEGEGSDNMVQEYESDITSFFFNKS